MKRLLILFFCLISISALSQKRIVFSEARFHTGDEPQWKDLDFDDSKWAFINPAIRWEEQGYKKYDGYAWYRFKFKLSSAMKQQAYWRDTLSVLLSKIDDVDESFLNGVKIGQTGHLPADAAGYAGKWDTYRVYNIPSNSKFINWDADNVIAVRVFDHSNGGGMFGPPPSVKIQEPQDVIKLQVEAANLASRRYYTTITNNSGKTVQGVWSAIIRDGANNRIVKTINKNIVLTAFKQLQDSIVASGNSRLEVVSSFKETHTQEVKSVLKVTPYILTPAVSPLPQVNSPLVFGVRPGSPFLFKIAATGKGVLRYTVANLPKGLSVNNATGIIAGKINQAGTYKTQVTVSNKLGKATQVFTIQVGGQLALTPPMGWNSWNCWGLSVTDEKVRQSARALISKGLINHGWAYVNIDDGWESSKRDDDGTLQANNKFEDMAGLSGWLHNNGLRFGIYSSPGPQTCGGYLGSYQHEETDAGTFAKWGIDYLKYDWCSYEDIIGNDTSLSVYMAPYKRMQQALKVQPRDIIYSLCQYGMKDVWKWGNSVSGNSWRTTNDLKDTWESVTAMGFNHPELYPYAKLGNWNDPDMLMVGMVGGWSGTLRPTLLTPDEQYAHISLWCMLSAPLLIGCDLTHIDAFTLSLLTNDEVIAINQDVLGKQAQQKIKTKVSQTWVKALADGGSAVGLFNMSDTYQDIKVDFNEVGLKGKQKVRDLWRQKTIAQGADSYTARVPPHGVALIKVSR